MFVEQHEAWVQAQKVLAVPFAVIVALLGKRLFVPGREPFVDEEVQLKMNMGAVLGDAFPGVGGSAHPGNGLARFDVKANFQVVADFFQVRVERISFQAVNPMAQYEIVSVVRQRRSGAEVNQDAVRGGHDTVRRFAARVPL